MNKIAVIYTSHGPLVDNFKNTLQSVLTDCEIIRIADDSLIADVKKLGPHDEGIKNRIFLHIESAILAGAQLVVIACSSVGQIAQLADEKYSVKVMRIDEAMMEKAIETGLRIGVVASVATTIEPTVTLLNEKAKSMNANINVIDCVANGAYEALSVEKNSGLHDELVKKAALGIQNDVDVIILAQGSMAHMEDDLNNCLSVPVLTSPKNCALSIKKALQLL